MRPIRTVAIDPVPRGLAFCVFEGSSNLIDFGTTYTKGKHTKDFVRTANGLFKRFKPELVVLEEPEGSPRHWRPLRRIEAIIDRATQLDIAVLPAPREAVKRTFADTGTTKYEVSVEIARRFPELKGRLPKKRTITTNEDERMHVFDALSFALTVLYELEST